ncbi:MAG: rRNA maturation RNase YbeY [Oceanicaulis sp.]
MSTPRLEFMIDDARWEGAAGFEALAEKAVEAGLARLDAARPGTAVVLLSGDAVLRDLNHRFRGKDMPTNVLSFPAPESEGYPGDLALAWETCAREAEAAGKSVVEHAVHLVLHGVLHLNGLDHQEEDEAAELEALESAVLTGLGIKDPYLVETES